MKKGNALFRAYKENLIKNSVAKWRHFAETGECRVFKDEEEEKNIRCRFCQYRNSWCLSKPSEYYKKDLNENEKWKRYLTKYLDEIIIESKKTWKLFMKSGDCTSGNVNIDCDSCPLFKDCCKYRNSNKIYEILNEEI